MKNTEVTKIREEKGLSKSEFAKLLGISAMLLGKYEKGSCKIPESVVEKIEALSDAAVATEIEVKKEVRKSARAAKEKVEAVATSDEAVATEIEVKKEVRKAARTVKETVEAAVTSDEAVATEIEVKKAVRKGGREAEEAIKKTVETAKETVKKIAGIPNIIIQSPMGGCMTVEEIAKKVPKKTSDVYVRVDENKLYYVLENGETGDVDIWD